MNNPFPNNNPLQQQVTVKAGGAPVPVIEQKIIIRPVSRRPVEIVDWRNAMKTAEAIVPRYIYMFDLFEEMWLDGHLQSVANKRIMGVTNAQWQYVNADKTPNDFINENVVDTPAFRDILKARVRAKMEAYRMVECEFENNKFNTYTVPPKHMRPRLGKVAFEQTSDDGINIREGIYAQTVLEMGGQYDLGIFMGVAQYVIYKRGGFADWANFVEVFGQPIVDAEWDGVDEKQRAQLDDAIDKMGNGGKITRPAGTKITLLENRANANGDMQDKFIDQLNEEISKGILGQTGTTESSEGSGYAQSKVMAGVEDDINLDDIIDTRQTLNTRFVEIMVALGIPGAKGGKFIIKGFDEEDISDKDSLEMDIALITDAKVPLGDDYFYERYNRPKPANYAALKKASQDAANAQMVDLNSDPLKPENAPTPPTSAAKTSKKPPAAAGEKSPAKVAKLAALIKDYDHFFGLPRS